MKAKVVDELPMLGVGPEMESVGALLELREIWGLKAQPATPDKLKLMQSQLSARSDFFWLRPAFT